MSHGLIFNGLIEDLRFKRAAGAHRIATFLRSNSMDIEVLDFLFSWTLDELKEFTKSRVNKGTTFFAFSVFASQWVSLYNEFLKWLKDTYPHIKIVFGGMTVEANTVVDSNYVDYFVEGYGEKILLELLKYMNTGCLDTVNYNLRWSNGRTIISAVNAFKAAQLDDYSIIYEKRDYIQPFEWSSLELSRGCKFGCAFCSYPLLNIKKDNTRTEESIRYELQYNYDNFGITKYYIMDSTFNDRIEKLSKVADVVESLDFTPWLAGEVRIDLVHKYPKMLEEFKRMNLWHQFFGIESFNDPTRKMIHKALSAKTIKETILTVSEEMSSVMPFSSVLSFIVGLPLEKRVHIFETLKWLNMYWEKHAVLWNSLFIENKEYFGTTTSEFANHPESFGISYSTPDPGKSYLEWSHSESSFFDAVNLTNETQPMLKAQGLMAHEYQYIEMAKQTPLTPKELLSFNRYNFNNLSDKGILDFIVEYKNKKLS